MKHVVISIINYNKTEITVNCLKSLNNLDLTNISLQVIVIDNASQEPITIDEKEYPHLSITIHYSKENTGFSGGHNIGFTYAKKHQADYIVILNNDTIVDKNLLKELILAGDANEKAGIIAPKIYFAKGSEYHKDRYKNEELGKVIWYAGGLIDWSNAYWTHRGVDEVDTGQYEKMEVTDYATGCCFAIKREVLKLVKEFDERYFLYFEDSDLSERVKKYGFSIYFNPKAIVWHENAASSGGSGSALQDYYTSRNRLLIGLRYAPLHTKLALIRESLNIYQNGRVWQKKGIRDFYLRRFGKGSYKV